MAVHEVGPNDRLVITGVLDDGLPGTLAARPDAHLVFLEAVEDVFIVRNGRTPNPQEDQSQ